MNIYPPQLEKNHTSRSVSIPEARYKVTGKLKPSKIETWLRKLISDIDHGILYTPKHGKPHPIHCNSNERVLEVLNGLPGRQWRYLEYLSNTKLARHFANLDTYYFTGHQRSKADCLILIDIDCHEFGTYNGAVAFAEWLRKNHWPNLFYERSTNGNGVHAYFVLQKCDLGATCINQILLHRLQPWLDEMAKDQGFDLELVEVKGTIPVLSWGDRRGELTNYKSGVLGKLPREAKERATELMTTTRLSAMTLMRLPVVHREPAVNCGSVTGKVIGNDRLARLGQYRALAEQLMSSHQIDVKGKNRTVATVEDVAIFLLLGEFFTENMNADGSMPWKRWAEMWDAVKQAGDVRRAFDSHRFAAVRNYFDSLGLIDWASNEFVIGIKDKDGVRRGGRACKWQFSDLLMDLLKSATDQSSENEVQDVVCGVGEGEASLAVTGFDDLLEEGREKASLAVTTIQTIIKSLIQKPWELLTRPELDDKHYLWRPDPDELTAYITPYELAA